MKIKIFLYVLMFSVAVFLTVKTVMATCNPTECGDPEGNPFAQCSASEHCVARCCISGGGGQCTSSSQCGAGLCCVSGSCTSNCGGGGGGGGGTGTCKYGYPGNLVVTRLSSTSAVATWSLGQNNQGETYPGNLYLYAGTNSSEVDSNCPGGSSCAVNAVLPPYTTSFTTSNLQPGNLYYWKVKYAPSCFNRSAWQASASSCLFVPPGANIQVGQQTVLTTVVSGLNSTSRVDFNSGNSSIASVNPPSDTTSLYQTTATAQSVGSTSINSNTYLTILINGNNGLNLINKLDCTSSATVNVTPLLVNAWWQVVDADLSTNGDITSAVPSGSFFGLAGSGGYPGIPSYGDLTNLTPLNVSTKGWLAQSSWTQTKVYDYNFFARQIPEDTQALITNIPSPSIPGSFFESGGTVSHGYYWYKYDAGSTGLDLTITGNTDIGSRRVVVLVKNSDLLISGNINLTDGQGFFGMFVNGATTIGPSVTSLEGIYLSDSSFSTGAGSTQLSLRGSVAAYGGVSLQRDLDGLNGTTPAEVFTFAPDQILLFPPKISYRRINWKERVP